MKPEHAETHTKVSHEQHEQAHAPFQWRWMVLIFSGLALALSGDTGQE